MKGMIDSLTAKFKAEDFSKNIMNHKDFLTSNIKRNVVQKGSKRLIQKKIQHGLQTFIILRMYLVKGKTKVFEKPTDTDEVRLFEINYTNVGGINRRPEKYIIRTASF